MNKEQVAADAAVMLKELAMVARSHGIAPLPEMIGAARREAKLVRWRAEKVRSCLAGTAAPDRPLNDVVRGFAQW